MRAIANHLIIGRESDRRYEAYTELERPAAGFRNGHFDKPRKPDRMSASPWKQKFHAAPRRCRTDDRLTRPARGDGSPWASQRTESDGPGDIDD